MKKSKFRSAFKVPRHSYDDFHRNEWTGAGNTNKRERLSTVDLLIKVLVFVQRGQLCIAFPFSKTSPLGLFTTFHFFSCPLAQQSPKFLEAPHLGVPKP